MNGSKPHYVRGQLFGIMIFNVAMYDNKEEYTTDTQNIRKQSKIIL